MNLDDLRDKAYEVAADVIDALFDFLEQVMPANDNDE